MKDVLIINLTRMGDLIQTTPAILGIKEQYPDARITLLVNTSFREICEYLPHVDRYFHIDKRMILNMIENRGFIEAYKYVKRILSMVNDRQYDMVINFTHSISSGIITSMINARDIRGISIDKKGYTVKKHPWIRYVFNVIPSRYVNPFHLCDMHFKSATSRVPLSKGLHLIVKEEKRRWVEEVLKTEGLKKGQPLVAFQLGASAEDKRWPVESFAILADMLYMELGAAVMLTGSKSELKYGEEFCQKTTAQTINLMGKTDLTELTALLQRADLLVSNDTGPLHIATAVGTRAIDISLASVHFRETGPYGEGHYVVAADIPCYPCNFDSNCEYLTCKKKITPEAVFAICRAILNEENLDLSAEVFKDLQVYVSCFEQDGLIYYRPLIRKPLTLNDLFMHLYRYTWQIVLDRLPFPENVGLSEYLDRSLRDYQENPEIIEELKEYADAFDRLKSQIKTLLSVVGVMKRAAQKGQQSHEFIERLWENIKPVDREIDKLGWLYPYLRPIVVLLTYEKQSFESDDLLQVITEAETAYKYALWQSDEIAKMLRKITTNTETSLTAVQG